MDVALRSTNTIDDLNLDFARTICPQGLSIEIEGHAPYALNLQSMYLGAGIVHAYVMITRIPVANVAEFLRRVTVLELDVERKYIKVRIT